MARKIFCSPHNDDETLYGAYTVLKEKPLVVICTDSYIQWDRGDEITAEERIEETKQAMAILGAEVKFLHIPDSKIGYKQILPEGERMLREKIKELNGDLFFAPAIEENGNATHNLVGKIVRELFGNVVHYKTYIEGNEKTRGSILVIPTNEEKELKKRALACYQSQMKINCKKYFLHPEILEWESYEK